MVTPRTTLTCTTAVGLSILLLGADNCSTPAVFTTTLQMRDGTILTADGYTPGDDRSPTVLIRTPYGRELSAEDAEKFQNEGYSVLVEDMRGTGASQGTFMLFMDDGWGATQDGYDTVEFVANQSWANGDVCTHGFSALAISSYLAGGAAHPNLKCAWAQAGSGDLYHHQLYQNGALRVETAVAWLAGGGWTEALDMVYSHPLDDGTWDPITLPHRYGEVTIPIYHKGGWYDPFQQSTLDAFSGLQEAGGPGAAGQQKLLMGPWTHGIPGQVEFPNSDGPSGEDKRWMDRWLNNMPNGIDTEPPVQYYLMGDPLDDSSLGNFWVRGETWPPPATERTWHLHPGGWLREETPPVDAGPATFTFNPADPVPTLGGANLTTLAGPWDQRLVLFRPDVLIYISEVLLEPVVVAGRIKMRLWVSSSAIDTDFTVKLMDVHPDATAMLITDGIQRMRFREGQDHETFMTPGQIYPVDIDLWSTAQVFNRGHRLGIAISSSNYPRFDVNHNTGGPLNSPTDPLQTADQVIYQDANHPSTLVLPVTDLATLSP